MQIYPRTRNCVPDLQLDKATPKLHVFLQDCYLYCFEILSIFNQFLVWKDNFLKEMQKAFCWCTSPSLVWQGYSSICSSIISTIWVKSGAGKRVQIIGKQIIRHKFECFFPSCCNSQQQICQLQLFCWTMISCKIHSFHSQQHSPLSRDRQNFLGPSRSPKKLPRLTTDLVPARPRPGQSCRETAIQTS